VRRCLRVTVYPLQGMAAERAGHHPAWVFGDRVRAIAVHMSEVRGRLTNVSNQTGPETAEVNRLAATILAECGPVKGWNVPRRYPDGLALGVIDSIQSIGVRYQSVQRVVTKYSNYRSAQGALAAHDGVRELRLTFTELGGVEPWASSVGNRHRTSTHHGAPLKALVVHDACQMLMRRDISSASDFREATGTEELSAEVEGHWRGLSGQRSGISWNYLRILAGGSGVKPDRMIRRFVAAALGRPKPSFTNLELIALVTAASQTLGVETFVTDHAIWRVQSGRKALDSGVTR
jgi:hypothetical protein